MTARAPTLSAAQARRLHDAEVAHDQLAARLQEARQVRDELRERYLPRIPLSDEPKEREAGTRTATVGGITVRVTPVPARETFSLAAYRRAGHAITAAMLSCISRSLPSHRWTVRPAAGPKRHDAVEPTR